MNIKDDVRVAIVGCGKIAGLHVSSVRRMIHAELAAVCDENGDLARQLAKNTM